MIDPSSLKKRYYKIGEVAEMFEVATSLIRYWESEFKQLKPMKGKTGIRRYLKEDILLIDQIYTLVKKEGYTLEGAQEALESNSEEKNHRDRLYRIREELKEIRQGLIDLKNNIKPQ